MKISQLIRELLEIQLESGDIDVVVIGEEDILDLDVVYLDTDYCDTPFAAITAH
jgi:uncharacterized protein (UPF0218 family)